MTKKLSIGNNNEKKTYKFAINRTHYDKNNCGMAFLRKNKLNKRK